MIRALAVDASYVDGGDGALRRMPHPRGDKDPRRKTFLDTVDTEC